MDTVEIHPVWRTSSPGFYTIQSWTELPGDLYHGNYTAYIEVEIRGFGELTGAVVDESTGEGISANLNFYHQEVSDEIPLASASTILPSGEYSLDLMAGEYRIEVTPVVPYNEIDFSGVNVPVNQTTEFDMELHPADILLVDDDLGMAYDTFLVSSLNSIGVESYHWDRDLDGELSGNAQLFDMCLWMTGNDSATTLLQTDKDELAQFLEAGGNLILSGQNIGDDLGANDPFLNDYLRVQHELDYVAGQFFLEGETGHPISDGTTLFLIGSGGAGNQNSQSSCSPLSGAEVVYRYQNAPNPIGAVCYYDQINDYHTVFLAFGIEAVSGMGGTTPRSELLTNIFEWWGFTVDAEISPAEVVADFQLLSAYPNPFNPSTAIGYKLQAASNVNLTVYDITGREVVRLVEGFQTAGSHCVIFDGEDLASGIYFVRLTVEGGQPMVTKMLLIK